MERSPQDLRKLQLEDGPISLLLQEVEKGENQMLVTSNRRDQKPNGCFSCGSVCLQIVGCSNRSTKTGSNQSWQQLVVPHTLREEIMREFHSGALEEHLGVDKTVPKIEERFYCPGMYQEVDQWIHTCPCCATRKSEPQCNCSPLQTIKRGYPLQVVTVDILGPLTESAATSTSLWQVTVLPGGWRRMLSPIRKQ